MEMHPIRKGFYYLWYSLIATKIFTIGLVLIGSMFDENRFVLVFLVNIQLIFVTWVIVTYTQILKEARKEYYTIKSENKITCDDLIKLDPPVKLEGCGRYSADIEFVCNECAVKATYLCEKFRKHNKTHKIKIHETVNIYL